MAWQSARMFRWPKDKDICPASVWRTEELTVPIGRRFSTAELAMSRKRRDNSTRRHHVVFLFFCQRNLWKLYTPLVLYNSSRQSGLLTGWTWWPEAGWAVAGWTDSKSRWVGNKAHNSRRSDAVVHIACEFGASLASCRTALIHITVAN